MDAQHRAAQAMVPGVLDEAGQAALVTAGGGFPEKGFEVLANHGVEHGVLGVARSIRCSAADATR
jgi:hypothetical protein